MATQRTGKTRVFSVSLPTQMADQVQQLAASQHRTTSELFREAFRTYRDAESTAQSEWSAALTNAQALAKRPGAPNPTEEEVQDFIDELRRERYAASVAKQ